MKTIALTCVLACLLMPGGPLAAEEWDNFAPSTILVVGSAEIEAEPDYVVWSLVLTDNDVSPVKAKEQNDAKYEAVLDLAKKVGVKPEDRIGGPVSIQKMYEVDERGRRGVFKDYAVRREVTLVQRDMDKFDDMLEELAAAAVEFELQYGSSKLDKLKEEARKLAVKSAKDKAEAMAREVNATIGRALRVVEEGADAGFDLHDALSNSVTVRRDAGRGEIRRGAISIRCSVQIVFVLIER